MSSIAIGYGRLSREAEDSGSPGQAVQREAVERYCRENGLTMTGWHFDDGESGSTMLATRPHGSGAIAAACEQGAVLVVHKLDRAFRSLLDFCSTVAAIKSFGGRLVSTAESFDLAEPAGWFTAAVLVAVAEFERLRITERINDNIAHKREHGGRIAPEAKYGWVYVDSGRVDAKGNMIEELVPQPQEQTVIRRILGMFHGGVSLREIAARLEVEGVPTRRGGSWGHNTVYDIVREGRARLAEKGKKAQEVNERHMVPCGDCGTNPCSCQNPCDRSRPMEGV